jgi:hypothetical protein
MTEFKITYNNGDKQTVLAELCTVRGDLFVFVDEKGLVHTVPVADVESVSRGDVPEREKRGPFVA